MDRTKTPSMKQLFGTLAFTAILAVGFIITGIIICSTQVTEIVTEPQDHKNGMKVINYADCEPIQLKFNKCEEVLETKSSCNCDIDFYIDQNLQGKVVVYSQIDSFNEVDSTIDRLFDKIESTFEKCNLTSIEESTSSPYCKPIPDDIFNDTFNLRIYNSSDESVALAHFSKSNSLGYLKMDYEDFKMNRQNRILTVSMETDSKNIELENGLLKGKYHLKMTYRPRTYKNTARVIVFSTENILTVTTPHQKISGLIIGISLLFLGFILCALIFAVYIQRKRILALVTNNVTDDPTNNVSLNNRHLESLAEEKPLSSTNNDT